MLIFVNIDTEARARQRLFVRIDATLRYRLAHFARRLARVEVHVSDPASGESTGEKSCRIKARAKGLAPVAIAEQALTFELALAGAAAKTVAALEQAFAPLRSGKNGCLSVIGERKPQDR